MLHRWSTGRATYLVWPKNEISIDESVYEAGEKATESDTLICRDISAFMMRKIKFQGEIQHTAGSRSVTICKKKTRNMLFGSILVL